MPALGDEFRAAREARHLTLSDVSEQIHIRSTYLESIEREDWSAIAAPVYVKGFIRTYARFLGLDQEDAVRRYAALVADGAPGSGPAPRPVRGLQPEKRGPSPLVWIGGGVAIALVAFVLWSLYQYRSQGGVVQASPQVAAGSAMPDAAGRLQEGPASPAAARTERTLTLRAKSDCWLRVDVDGTATEFLLKAGTEKSFHGSRISLTAGNAGGVTVVANGKDLGTLGAPGDVVDRTFDLTKE